MADEDEMVLLERIDALERELHGLKVAREENLRGKHRGQSLMGMLWSALVQDDGEPEIDEGALAVIETQLSAVQGSLDQATSALRELRAAKAPPTPQRVPVADAGGPRPETRLIEALDTKGMGPEGRATLQQVLESLRLVGRRVERRAIDAPLRSAPPRGRTHGRTSMAHRSIERAAEIKHEHAMESARADWQQQGRALQRRLEELGLRTELPGLRQDGQRVTEPVAVFAASVGHFMPVLDAWLESVRREGDGARPGDARREEGADAALKALVEGWERLLEVADELERAAARPQVRTVQLLGPVSAWNRQAEQVAALARVVALPLEPPVNQGGDLQAFVARIREGRPGWEAELEALRAMI